MTKSEIHPMTTDTILKTLAGLVGLAGLVFGVVKYVQVQTVEAEKPYLERKLAWCEEAVETTSRIATAATPSPADIERFRQMYWGVMGLIEKKSITCAMISFGAGLDRQEPPECNGTPAPTGSLKERSLALAHACRQELAAEWSPSWTAGR